MGTNGDKSPPARKLSAWSPHMPDVGGMDPAIHNSNTSKFRGARLAVPYAEDHRFPEEVALEAVRQFIDGRGPADHRSVISTCRRRYAHRLPERRRDRMSLRIEDYSEGLL